MKYSNQFAIRSFKHNPLVATLFGASILGFSPTSIAQDNVLPAVSVDASRTSQIGVAESANAGFVTQEQLEARTVYRAGETLEAMPGLIVSQHSGEGKANQFYLRGFNLDHGTDLRTSVDGMLVNQRSHGHGQGWTDLNFLIPELANRLDYKKGPYYASEGDFASAGAVSVLYPNRLDQGLASIGIGQNGYRRTLLMDAPKAGNGNLLYALELFHNDGPFTNPDDYRKLNGVLRYSEGTTANGFNVTAMAYRGNWNATDQIPRRAVESGLIGRFDAIDPTDGGNARRYSLSSAWRQSTASGSTNVNAYVIRNELDLYSNFTYFDVDPVNGDQFNQRDKRTTTGMNASHTWPTRMFGRESDNTIGLQLQNDNIFNGLFGTAARQRLSTTRADHIVESSAGIYFENNTRWTDTFRTVAGLREDFYRFNINSDNPANSGKANDSIASPKLSLIFGPWAKTEYYFNIGSGFHSNDARGTTITIDPASGEAADRVPPLVRSKGAELGIRTEIIPGLQSSFSVYQLDFDSELVFVGDAGTTEAGRPSRRLGFEFNNYYKPTDWLTIDADLAFARARFRGFDPTGRHIPGAVEGVASVALAVNNIGPYFGALQLRYFGPRPLIEDNSVRSKSTATLNGRIGYKINKKTRIELEGFNLTNRKDSAIDYYYASRLTNEPVGTSTDDIHFHPIESRSFRVTLNMNF
ncbi:TonB-dependent receptor [Noviherbaspirillum saxi]|uniref:TonB-dependent receptor n=1 Tax=Noviherbaspirillum saxi TaxID=2320863 RepID=A0A3A3FJC1_9BURK|nr:TonB-dependent receptor [Noviherbaspirillum saxi]RJF92654.1 TonB-dependent receptor [Noviherbaspirillum saxi]